MSDRTWTRFGRRKPYFFLGAVLSCFALVLMPYSSALWMAAGMLCILDASINISMEPFRALVADKLPDEQRTIGFTTQSILIGLGAVFASCMPVIFTWLGVSNIAEPGIIPNSVKYSFFVGAACFMAAIIYTNATTPEYPPEDMAAFEEERKKSGNPITAIAEIFNSIVTMPKTMLEIALVQLFTWFALFAMWTNSTPAITAHVFGTSDTTSAAYNEGANFVGICFAGFNGVAAIMGFIIPALANKLGRKYTHMLCLLLGSAGLLSIFYVHDKYVLLGSYALIGIAWASILSMPYAMLSAALPANKVGVYMGLFNMFICIPQIVASLGGLNFLTHTFIGPSAIHGIVLAGILMALAAVSVLVIKEEHSN
jgi:maltose/moltooligosaccharide transporter